MIKILISLLLFLSAPVIAEQEDETSTTNINSEQTEATENNKSTNSITIKTPDSFDPTETLSQDVPTAFPVDI